MLSPIIRALAQLDDPVFLGVLARSVSWSVLAFVGLLAGSTWGVQELVVYFGVPGGWLAWMAGIAGGLGAALLAVWLFVPAAVLIATLYSDRVADAVDRRFYPALPNPRGAPIAVQAWDGVVLALQVLALQVVSLVLALLIPGAGLVLGWLITGWAIGRGLFVAVAMRRMDRRQALQAYADRRWVVLGQGAALALAATVPLLNLMVPVLGVAALTHVLNERLALPHDAARLSLTFRA